MAKKLPVGVDNFGKLTDPKNNFVFADKTLFIQEIINDGAEVTLITRPRRWGKTLNMSMLHYFFSAEVYGQKTMGLFESYAIAKVEDGDIIREHQGQYPVIFVSFKDIKEPNFAIALEKFKLLIQELCRQHYYLHDSLQLTDAEKDLFETYLRDAPDQSNLENSLKTLSELLYKHYNKPVYILIDEYDTPLNAAYNKGYLEEMTNFLRNLFSAALKTNPALKKGVLTGVLRISKDSMLSGLNNIEVYTVLNKAYNRHFGFTSQELDALFFEQGLLKDETRVKDWYNGYCVGGLTLYNPWSIINTLKNEGELRPYWVNTADDALLRTVLQNASITVKIKFQQLLEGKTIEGAVSENIRYENITNDEVSIWSLLLYTGYLKALSAEQQGTRTLCALAIPNQEVFALYEDCFIDWMNAAPHYKKLKQLLENLVEGHIEKFTKEVSIFLQTAASIHDYATQPEAFYHGFMLALTAGVIDNYYVESNRESGDGRPDLLFIPKDSKKTKAVILEFKPVKKGEEPLIIAQQALAQIDTKAYATTVKQYQYIKHIYKVGLAFDGKQVHCVHQIDANT